MDKDYSMKHDPQYSCEDLRERITAAVKRLRDETDEVKRPKVKQHYVIPVTGTRERVKSEENKTLYKFDAPR